MNLPAHTRLLKVITLLLFPLLPYAQNLFVNGSMNGFKGEAITADGWTAILSTPDLNDENGPLKSTAGYNWYGGPPKASPDGGNWQNVFDLESFGQTVTGLTPGKTYYFSYYYSSQPIYDGYSTFDKTAAPYITFKGAEGYTNPPATSEPFTWYSYCSTLLATSSTVTIEVTSREFSYLAYDGFYLSLTPFSKSAPVVVSQPAATSVCAGTKASFSTAAENAQSYRWQENNGDGNWTFITDNDIYQGTATGTLSVSSAGATLNGHRYRCCFVSNCYTVYSSPAALTVFSSATPALSISTPADAVCTGANTELVFTAKPENAGAPVHFQWMKNGAAAGTDEITYRSSSLKQDDRISCKLTTGSQCATANTATSNEIIIREVAPVTPSVSITATAASICAGATVSFTASAVNGGTAAQYQWTKNGAAAGNTSGTYTDKALSDKDIIRCTMVSSLTCLTAPAAYSNPVQMSVTQWATPQISIQPARAAVCEGTLVVFTATIANAGSSQAYSWEKNGVVQSSSAAYTLTDPAPNDQVSCRLQASGECLTATQAASSVTSVQVFPLPVVQLNHRPLLCGDERRVLDAGQFASYLWNDNSTGRTLTISATGQYSITVTDANGCRNSDTTVITAIVPLPAAFLPADTSLCTYNSLLLAPAAAYGSYRWNDGTKGSSIEVKKAGIYWLQVLDANQCTGRDSVVITAKECLEGFFMPTAFTPNHDGVNDDIKPLLFGNVLQYRFTVFDRWGRLLFTSANLHEGWKGLSRNGQFAGNGTYIWSCVYRFAGGNEQVQKGTVVLLR